MIEAALSVLKTPNTLILPTSYNISNQVFLNNDYSPFKFVACLFFVNNQCCLMFANQDAKKFYYINPFLEMDKYQKFLFDQWM